MHKLAAEPYQAMGKSYLQHYAFGDSEKHNKNNFLGHRLSLCVEPHMV